MRCNISIHGLFEEFQTFLRMALWAVIHQLGRVSERVQYLYIHPFAWRRQNIMMHCKFAAALAMGIPH